MKTHRVILSEYEFTEALAEFAYGKLGRRAPAHVKNTNTILVFASLPDGGHKVEQARVEMDLPDDGD